MVKYRVLPLIILSLPWNVSRGLSPIVTHAPVMEEPISGPETVVERRPVGTIRLRVLSDGTLRITAPPGIDVEPFIQRRSGWIARKRQEMAKLAADAGELEHSLVLCGEPYRLVQGDRCSVDADLHEVVYTTPAALKRYLAGRWRRGLEAAVARLAPPMGVEVTGISVRMQRTRWASCSARGHLSFNLVMIALPPHLREYVMVHELAHRRHLDHSRAFWRCVGKYYPDYPAADRELGRYWVILERNACWQVLRGAEKPPSR